MFFPRHLTYTDNDDQTSIYTNYTNYNDAFVVVYSSNIFDSENIVLLIVDSLWHGQATSTTPWHSWSRYSALANCQRRCGRRTFCILFSPRHSVQRLCRTHRLYMWSDWKRRRCTNSRSREPGSSVFEHSRPCWTTKERCSSVSRREREGQMKVHPIKLDSSMCEWDEERARTPPLVYSCSLKERYAWSILGEENENEEDARSALDQRWRDARWTGHRWTYRSAMIDVSLCSRISWSWRFINSFFLRIETRIRASLLMTK